MAHDTLAKSSVPPARLVADTLPLGSADTVTTTSGSLLAADCKVAASVPTYVTVLEPLTTVNVLLAAV